jgi:large subunit ribosomal protein L23
VSEKAYATAQKGVYIFVVPSSVNKHQVAEAVKAQYGVDVVSVNIVVQKGKAVRFYRAGKFENGTRSDMKKAYVRLAEGQSIPIFAAEEQEAPKEEKAAKSTKKGAKE